MKVNDDATKSKSASFDSRYFDPEHRLPKETDFLFAYSTLEDYLSYRDEEDGTWYIQMLCKAILEEESKEISAILTYTHALISKMVGTNHNKDNEVNMTLTYVESRLSKLFFISRPPQVGNKNLFFLFFECYNLKI